MLSIYFRLKPVLRLGVENSSGILKFIETNDTETRVSFIERKFVEAKWVRVHENYSIVNKIADPSQIKVLVFLC